ncbi:hypothetical protein [Streptomyces sp. NPDC058092]|uniref:hypothetical protein n=1 Tax=Streptomyces sp. NPDC058092 TaxID=3346336 RepID=UPI0036ED0237
MSEAAWAGLEGAGRAICRGLTSKALQEMQQTEWFRQAAILLGSGVLILMVVHWIVH